MEGMGGGEDEGFEVHPLPTFVMGQNVPRWQC